jgi:hypothetical protein
MYWLAVHTVMLVQGPLPMTSLKVFMGQGSQTRSLAAVGTNNSVSPGRHVSTSKHIVPPANGWKVFSPQSTHAVDAMLSLSIDPGWQT